MPVAVSPSGWTNPNMTCVSFPRDFANVKKVVRLKQSKKRLVICSRQHRQATGPPLAFSIVNITFDNIRIFQRKIAETV